MRESIRLLKTLTDADGPPGFEHEVRAIMEHHLGAVGTLRHDRIGGVLAQIGRPKRRRTPRIALACHMDEVGFLVQSVRADGFLRLAPLGGLWNAALPGQRIRFLAPSGKIPGVIGATPPHLLPQDQRERVPQLDHLYADVGAANREQAEAWGIRPGTPACFAAPLSGLGDGNLLVAKALDNRAGCALCIETAALLQKSSVELIILATAQEEVGSRGAPPLVTLAKPDLAIIVETGPADDTPGLPSDEAQGRLGHGVQIRLADPTCISHPQLAQLALDTARQLEIPHQPCVRRTGGTDASKIHIHQTGVPSLVLSIPARYIHSSAGVLHLDDYATARRLLENLLVRLGDFPIT